jgi:integrase
LNYGAVIRLLILTGQRREEVGGLRWSELRLPDGIWSISAERTKNGKPHDVPLSTLALEILNAQSKREDRDLLFGARGGAFQGWSRAKEALDRRMLVALQNAHGEKAKLKPWRLHDIRRTIIFPGTRQVSPAFTTERFTRPKNARRCRSGPTILRH